MESIGSSGRHREVPQTAPHPSRAAVGRFVSNQASKEERLAVVRHLLGRCPRCARLVLDLNGGAV
jgi:hypothetical protein